MNQIDISVGSCSCKSALLSTMTGTHHITATKGTHISAGP